jgi:hypothetical protein
MYAVCHEILTCRTYRMYKHYHVLISKKYLCIASDLFCFLVLTLYCDTSDYRKFEKLCAKYLIFVSLDACSMGK